MKKRALPLVLGIVVLAAIAVLLFVLLNLGSDDEPDTPAGAPPVEAVEPEDEEDERGRRRSGQDDGPATDLSRPPRTPYLARFPEIGQFEEQDPENGAVRGRVLLAPGRPAREAVVEISAGGAPIARVHADEVNGAFHVINVPPGTGLELTARAPGHANGGLDQLLVGKGETFDVGTVFLGAAMGDGVDNSLKVRVLDENGEALRGARVTASAVFYGALLMVGPMEKQPGGTMLRETTNASGEAIFDLLPPASYDVFAEADGYAFALRQRFTVQQKTRAIVELKMSPGLSISGTTVDAEGNPVADATVGALRFGDFQTFPPTTSDTEGKYTLGGLSPGNYMVIAFRNDHGGNMSSGVAAGATDVEIEIPLGGEITLRVTDKATGEPIRRYDVRPFEKMPFAYLFAPLIEAEADENGEFSFMMPESDYGMELSAPGYAVEKIPSVKSPSEEPFVVELEPAGIVHGRVVARDTGAPVAGADVFVKKGGFPPTRFKDLRTTTDANGVFVLDRLTPTALSLWVSHVDHSEQAFEGVEPLMRGEDGALPPQVEMVLGSGGVIAGRVLDASHLPVAGQNMQLSQGFDMFSVRNTTTVEDGSFEFRNVPPGRNYTVSVGTFQPGQPGQSRSDVNVTEGGAVTVDFGVQTGGVALTGRVLDGEAPASGVSVSLVSDDGGGSLVQVRTDAEGRFTFEGVQPGRYQATAQGGRTRSVTVVVPDEGAAPELEIVLVDTEVRGRVVDGATGEPLGGIYVECERVTEGGSSSLGSLTKAWKGNDMTDQEGVFSVDGLEDGTYRVRAIPSGYAAALVDGIRVADGQSVTDLEIRLAPAGTVAGSVRNSAGTPVEGVQLTVRNAAGVPLFLVGLSTSGSDGSYTQGSLPEGRFTLTFKHEDYAPTSKEVDVALGQTISLDVTLLQGGKVEVVVKGADGNPVDGALVKLLDPSGKELPKDYALSSIFSLTTDKTDANGQCQLRGVAEGKYMVVATRGELTIRSGLVEVFEGGSTTVEVALPGAR